jgi:hypothetical protein
MKKQNEETEISTSNYFYDGELGIKWINVTFFLMLILITTYIIFKIIEYNPIC